MYMQVCVCMHVYVYIWVCACIYLHVYISAYIIHAYLLVLTCISPTFIDLVYYFLFFNFRLVSVSCFGHLSLHTVPSIMFLYATPFALVLQLMWSHLLEVARKA